MEAFWSKIWSEEVSHDEGADWLKDMEDQSGEGIMSEVHIDVTDVQWVLKSANNWAAPGVDNIHNFW